MLPVLAIAALRGAVRRSPLGRVPRAVRLAPWIALGCAALLASAGCGEAIPVRPAESAEALGDAALGALLDEAGGLLERPIEITDRGYGAITLALIDDGGRYAGEQLTRRGCRRAVWSEVDAALVAHELGHALGLEHVVDDPANLMYPHRLADAPVLEDWQRDELEDGILGLRACP